MNNDPYIQYECNLCKNIIKTTINFCEVCKRTYCDKCLYVFLEGFKGCKGCKLKYEPMYVNKEFLETKTNIDCIKYCIDKINELKRHRIFYIGISKNPLERLLQHVDNNDGYNLMYILSSVPTKNDAIYIEQQLIRHFRECDKLGNIGDGGEGIKDTKNFVYVMFKNM